MGPDTQKEGGGSLCGLEMMWSVSGGGGSAGFCFFFFLQFFAIFHNFFCDCVLPVHVRVCVLVPCVSPVQKRCFLRLRKVLLRHRNFPATFPQFSAIGLHAP